MKSITFTCNETIPLVPGEISKQILDLTKWPEFRGYGPIPGIKSAEFETRTHNVIGSRIRVTNVDGSTHIENIMIWQPDRRLQFQMGSFSKPLSSFASNFVETWEFEWLGSETKVVRSFELSSKSMLTMPVLWLISLFLKWAVARHLGDIKEAVQVHVSFDNRH